MPTGRGGNNGKRGYHFDRTTPDATPRARTRRRPHAFVVARRRGASSRARRRAREERSSRSACALPFFLSAIPEPPRAGARASREGRPRAARGGPAGPGRRGAVTAGAAYLPCFAMCAERTWSAAAHATLNEHARIPYIPFNSEEEKAMFPFANLADEDGDVVRCECLPGTLRPPVEGRREPRAARGKPTVARLASGIPPAGGSHITRGRRLRGVSAGDPLPLGQSSRFRGVYPTSGSPAGNGASAFVSARGTARPVPAPHWTGTPSSVTSSLRTRGGGFGRTRSGRGRHSSETPRRDD